MVLGRDPGQNEDRNGRVFIGRAGQLINQFFSEVGIKREDIYITNAVKCATPNEDKEPGKKELKYCQVHLAQEIEETKPNVVLAFGNSAMAMLLGRSGIKKLQNQVLYSDTYKVKVVPVVHPAYILRNPADTDFFRQGLKIALREAESAKVIGGDKLKTKYRRAKTAEEAAAMLREAITHPAVAFDLETSALSWLKAQILCLSMSWKIGHGCLIPWQIVKESADVQQCLREFLHSSVVKIGHNLKFDLHHLAAKGFDCVGPYRDTIIAHSLIDENSEQGLDTLVLRYTDMGEYWEPLEKFKKAYCKKNKIKQKDFSYAFVPPSMLYLYAVQDADATFRLDDILRRMLVEEDQADFYEKYSMPLMPILSEMEYRGILIDREKLLGLAEETRKKIEEMYAQIESCDEVKKYNAWRTKQNKIRMLPKLQEAFETKRSLRRRFFNFKEYAKSRFSGKKFEPHVFNMNSPTQLKELFFDVLKLRPPKLTAKTKTASTDKEVLVMLAEEQGAEIASILNEYRGMAKYLATCLEAVYHKSSVDGRIHTNYIQHAARTGRLSSRDPNLQTLPREAYDFKSCFLADPGYTFVKADLAQAEFRVWASCANDTKLIEHIESGFDVHSYMAEQIFGIKKSDIEESLWKKVYRQKAKSCTFGMMYGIGSKALAKNNKITIEQADSVHGIFGAAYPIAVAWLEKQIAFAHKHRYVASWMGRKRRLPNIDSQDPNIVAMAERQAMNSPIQAAASDMNNAYMVRIIRIARKHGLDVFPAMTTHDENVIMVRKGQEKKLVQIMLRVVEKNFPTFRCKMEFEFKIGNSIGTAEVYDPHGKN